MSIYHLNIKIIGRTAGRDATAASAYRAAEKIRDDRTGLTHNYLSRKNSVLAEGIFMPTNSVWQPSRSELWNMVELKNKRKDSQTAREVEIALPFELSDEQRWNLVSGFSTELVERYGVAADAVIHAPRGENKNFHSHIMLTTDRIEGKELGNKNRDMNAREELEHIREMWENFANQALARAGHDVRIDRRTLKEQGLDREATQHEGVAVAALERKEVRTRVREENLRRKAQEQERQDIQLEIKKYDETLRELEQIETEAESEREFQEAQESRERIAAELKRAQEQKIVSPPPQPVESVNYEKLFVEYVRNQRREDGRDFVSKNKPIIKFSSVTPPSPVEIYGYEATPHEDGAVFYHNKFSQEVVFVDRQTSVEVFDKSDKTIVEMLNLSAKKWTEGFELTGSEEFRLRAEALAEKWGLADKIKNPLNPAPKEELRPETEKPEPITAGSQTAPTLPVRESETDSSPLIDAPAEQKVDNLADEEEEEIAEDRPIDEYSYIRDIALKKVNKVIDAIPENSYKGEVVAKGKEFILLKIEKDKIAIVREDSLNCKTEIKVGDSIRIAIQRPNASCRDVVNSGQERGR